jgi:hypothetical protein
VAIRALQAFIFSRHPTRLLSASSAAASAHNNNSNNSNKKKKKGAHKDSKGKVGGFIMRVSPPTHTYTHTHTHRERGEGKALLSQTQSVEGGGKGASVVFLYNMSFFSVTTPSPLSLSLSLFPSFCPSCPMARHVLNFPLFSLLLSLFPLLEWTDPRPPAAAAPAGG